MTATIIVTGASRGIGAAIAMELARAGLHGRLASSRSGKTRGRRGLSLAT